MRDMPECDDRIGIANRVVAGLVAAACVLAMWMWSVPGVDPSVWEEIAVVSGLRPARTVFPGFWRLLAGWLFPLVGTSGAIKLLNFGGVMLGGVCVYFFCLIVRQILALVVRFGRPYAAWHRFIAPFFMAASGLCFGLSDPLWSITRTFSPEEIRLTMFLLIVHGSVRWFVAGGQWRLFPVMALMGVMSAETSFACLLPIVFMGAYFAVWHCVLDELFPKPEKLPEPGNLPKWRMFFLYLGGLAAAVCLNVSSFFFFDGLPASGMTVPEVYFRYAAGYWHVFADAATLAGWVLGICCALLPLVVALRIAPLVIRDDRPMQFNLGVLLFMVFLLTGLQVEAKTAAFTVADIPAETYTGTAHEPTPEVRDGSTVLTKDTDYTLSYENNVNAGTATVTVTGAGNYAGSSGSATFTINQATLTAKAQIGSAAAGANVTIRRGDAVPTYSVVVTGFVNGETTSTAAGYTAPTVSCTYTTTSPSNKAGYSVKASGGAAKNYSFSYTDVKLIVMPRGTVFKFY